MSLRRLIFEDFWLKLFSLGVAMLIWGAVRAAVQRELEFALTPQLHEDSHTYKQLPVLVVSASGDVRDCKVRPSHVDVKLGGETATLKRLLPQDLRVIVDLTSVKAAPGARKNVEVLTPPGLWLRQTTPPMVEVLCPQAPTKPSL